MAGRQAARLMDPTVHGTPLKPGPGSPNVIIGRKPAWRGLSAAGAAALAVQIAKIMESVQKFTLAMSVNDVFNAGEALDQLRQDIPKAIQIMGSVDQHICEMLLVPPVPPPHGPGVVINGSATVMINGLPACRQGDTIQETLSVNSIAMGCPTVFIGG